MREQICKDKGYLDLCSPTLIQRLLDIYYRKYIDKALPKGLKVYKRRYETMAKAMDETFPAGKRTDPTGGFFIWWESEDATFDTKQFLEQTALPNDIIYVPGIAFYPLRGFTYRPDDDQLVDVERPTNTMRISYSFTSAEIIEKGIRKLGKLLKKQLS
jgi:2-aminoadipate transaminase